MSLGGVPKSCEKFTGKQLCWSLISNNIASLRSATLLKKRLRRRCFLVNFAIILKTLFLKEHLWWLLLDVPLLFNSLQYSVNLQQNTGKYWNKCRNWQKNRTARRLQNPVTPLRCSVLRVNYFCKTLHVGCLTGFWICQ